MAYNFKFQKSAVQESNYQQYSSKSIKENFIRIYNLVRVCTTSYWHSGN